MEDIFGIVTAQHCYLRSMPGRSEWENASGIEDEIFSGWAVRLLAEEKEIQSGGYTEKNGWMYIETHYGYKGYVRKSELRLIDRAELLRRQDKTRFVRVKASEVDLLSMAKVQGLPLELIEKNAEVEIVGISDAEMLKTEKQKYETESLCSKTEDRSLGTGKSEIRKMGIPAGWVCVRTAAGREGYVHRVHLMERKDDDGYLLERNSSEVREKWCNSKIKFVETQQRGYFRRCCNSTRLDEDIFRQNLVRSALSYLGTQYRWGGKSSQGIDCSGLLFMSYLENGVLIYRDAKIMPDYPMREISRADLKPGDAIYFPGHVAMYLGNDKYIHATGQIKTAGVTINSLNPADVDYRADLAQRVTAYGSIFER